MAFIIMRNFNVYSAKFLFTNISKPQLSREMYNIDCRPFSSKTLFANIHSLFMNFRTLFISTLLKDSTKKITLTFLTHDGKRFKKRVPLGKELVYAFETGGNEIPCFGLCGGNQSCATCHIKIPENLVNKLKIITEDEEDTLICANEFDPRVSRLSCCLKATEEMNGAVMYVPEIIHDKRKKD